MKRSIVNSPLLIFEGYVQGTSFRRYCYRGRNLKYFLIPFSQSLLNIKDFEVSKSVYLSLFNSINFD